MTAAPDPAARDAFGRFQPGCSGNPAGRPVGSRSAASILKEQLRGDQVDAAVQIIGDALAAGSEATARFVIKQIDPKKRAPLVAFEYPPGASLIERFQALFAAAAHGEITPEEALALSRVLEAEGNMVVKASGLARDLENHTLADQARADAARAEAEAVQAEAKHAAPAAPAEDAALLKACSIWPPADAAAPGLDAKTDAPPSPLAGRGDADRLSPTNASTLREARSSPAAATPVDGSGDGGAAPGRRSFSRLRRGFGGQGEGGLISTCSSRPTQPVAGSVRGAGAPRGDHATAAATGGVALRNPAQWRNAACVDRMLRNAGAPTHP
ncbi:MAG: hypothetical protein HY060_25520 [Proteobacteria bacterium]|nr:hypothetical protein [Pseudomonadota bacterium]